MNRAMYKLTGWGDSSVVWHMAGVVGALRRHDDLEYAVRMSSVQGMEAAIVNGPVKWMFRRDRPLVVTEHAHYLRLPRTSSFPSGHASAAACAVVMLWEGAGPLERLGWTALGGAVAWSRVHVGVHHASDVLAGASIGVGLGLLARRFWPLR
ncbi:MAG TPA: phosphatase PAP2 family protein [Microthrixaceae bacterium]|nr:phosphatase PAP2 family protein [Microthrixaceae bacterium]